MIYAYIRASTGKQIRTLDAQREVIIRYMAMRGKDAALVTFIEDADVTGGMPFHKRPGGSQIMADVASGKVESLVVATLDRAFRLASDALNAVDTMIKHNCNLCVADFNGMPIDAGTPIGKMLLTMLAGFAEFEKARIGERTKLVLKDAVAKGEIVFNPKWIPLGFKPYGDRVTPDGKHVPARIIECQEEQAALTRVKELIGSMSPEKIGDVLAQEGYTRYNGRPINGRMIRHYLRKG